MELMRWMQAMRLKRCKRLSEHPMLSSWKRNFASGKIVSEILLHYYSDDARVRLPPRRLRARRQLRPPRPPQGARGGPGPREPRDELTSAVFFSFRAGLFPGGRDGACRCEA